MRSRNLFLIAGKSVSNSMGDKFTEPKLRNIHKSEVKSYFETWLSLQLPRLLKQMDDAEVYRNAFLINTWVQNNSRKKNQAKDKHGKFITLEEMATLMMSHLKDDPDGMRKFVQECEVDINEEYKTDLSNDVDVVNKYGAILGIEIVKEWWEKEGQKAHTDDLFGLMRK